MKTYSFIALVLDFSAFAPRIRAQTTASTIPQVNEEVVLTELNGIVEYRRELGLL